MDPSLERPFLIIFQIGLSIHHLNARLEKKSKISLTQWAILQELFKRPATSPFVLAKAVGILPGTLTPALGRLKRKGLVFVGNDPKDSRKKILSLTRKGKETIDTADKQVVAWRDQLGISRQNLADLRDTLRSLK